MYCTITIPTWLVSTESRRQMPNKTTSCVLNVDLDVHVDVDAVVVVAMVVKRTVTGKVVARSLVCSFVYRTAVLVSFRTTNTTRSSNSTQVTTVSPLHDDDALGLGF